MIKVIILMGRADVDVMRKSFQRIPAPGFDSMDMTKGEQVTATGIYKFIENWWGQELDRTLLEHVAAAPDQHAECFLEEWRDIYLRWQEQGGDPNNVNDEFVPLIGRELGVSTRSREALSKAVALLLLTRRVAVDERFLFPSTYLGGPYRSSYRDRPLATALYHLASVRSLVEDGSLVFVEIPPDKLGDPVARMKLALELTQNDRKIWESFGLKPRIFASGILAPGSEPVPEIETTLYDVCGAIISSLEACQLSNTSPIATAPWMEYAYGKLITRRKIDGRIAKVDRLATVKVPHIIPERISDIVSIRKTSEAYGNLRNNLHQALSEINQLPVGDDAIRIAGEILYDELKLSTDALEGSFKKSSSLSMIKNGMLPFGFGSVSIAMGADWSDPNALSIAGSAVDKVGDGVISYLKNLGNKRSGKAVLGVVASFNQLDPKTWKDPYWEIDNTIDRGRN